jgi:tetratricopeptide (TPR) repeat protein
MNPMKKTLSWSAILLFLAANVANGQPQNESELSDTNSFYYNFLNGKRKSDTGDYDGAIIFLTKAIELKPDDIGAFGMRGWAEYSKGDYDKAIADYTKCAELQPDDFNPYMYRGWAKERKGDHNGAIADYTKIIGHEKGPTALFNGAYLNRGESKKAKGDFDGAITDLTKAIELWSDVWFSAYLDRSEAKKAKGDLTGALADCTKAIELGRNLSPPQFAEVYENRGCVYYDQHSFTNALVDFYKVLEFDSAADSVHFRIWLAQAQLGENEKATRDLKNYLQNRQNGKLDDWPAKIGGFLAGELNEAAFFRAAKNTNANAMKSQMCQAYFYAGTKHLIDGDKRTSASCFKKCLATDQMDSADFWSASNELKFLKAEK